MQLAGGTSTSTNQVRRWVWAPAPAPPVCWVICTAALGSRHQPVSCMRSHQRPPYEGHGGSFRVRHLLPHGHPRVTADPNNCSIHVAANLFQEAKKALEEEQKTTEDHTSDPQKLLQKRASVANSYLSMMQKSNSIIASHNDSIKVAQQEKAKFEQRDKQPRTMPGSSTSLPLSLPKLFSSKRY